MLGAADFDVDRSRPRPRLSLDRPRPLPTTAPRGRDARDIRFDGFIDHPGYGLTPASLLNAFRLAEQGQPQRQCRLTDDLVERDAHLRSLLEQRRNAVAGKPWVVQPGEAGADAELDARVFALALKRLPMIQVFDHLLDFNSRGYAGVEIDWDVVDLEGRSWIVPVSLTLVPAERFRIGTVGMLPIVPVDELRLFADVRRPNGDELRPGKWLTMRRLGGILSRAGLCRTFSWLSMGKSLSWRDWLILSEKFGLPIAIATYEDSGDDEAKNVARQIIENIGNDGGAVVSKAITLELHKGVESDTVLQDLVIKYCNSEMSKLINGSTLSNDSNGSSGASYALGDIHNNLRWENVKYDAERLEEAITSQLASAFCQYNARKAAPPRLRMQVARDFSPISLLTLATGFKNQLGIEVSQSQLREECGLRAPVDEGDAAPGAPMPEPDATPKAPKP